VNRRDLKELSTVRLREAKVLSEAECWDGAYYLAGYAVECALKACIAKTTARYDFPAKQKVVDSHTHNLNTLVIVAGMEKLLKTRSQSDLVFREHWNSALDWSEKSRYERISQESAEELLVAVSERRHGIIPWVKQHW